MSGLDVFALIVLIVLLVVAIAALIGLGMLPGKIAKQRNHRQADAINVAGWLGVLSLGILYPLGLIWAFTKPPPESVDKSFIHSHRHDSNGRVAALPRQEQGEPKKANR